MISGGFWWICGYCSRQRKQWRDFFVLIPQYRENDREAALEVKRRARWRTRKGVRWRPGEGPVERALTSCEFGQLKQVLQLSSELGQKARDEIRGMIGMKESLRGVDSWRC